MMKMTNPNEKHIDPALIFILLFATLAVATNFIILM